MFRLFILFILALFFSSANNSLTQTLSIPPDTAHWELEGNANITEYLDRKCIYLNGAAAIVKNYEMRDCIIDLDVSTSAKRGFFGIDFRVSDDGRNAEYVYLRPHKSGYPDAIQYTPVLNGGLNWQIYNGPGFTGATDIPKDVWFHLRLEVTGAQANLFVKNMDKPALVIDDLKSGRQKGQIAFYDLIGETYISNFEIKTLPETVWQHHLPPFLPGAITRWSLSPSYDALTHNMEHALSPAESDTIHWQNVEAEPPGFVTIYRYRIAPHIKVTFADDFSKRLDPQPGMKVIFAKTDIKSDSDKVKKLYIGYSDDVSVLLNGKILFRGRSAQNFRDPGFLGIVNAEDDAVYLPLRKGNNELMLVLSELGGGWGFICRLADFEN